MKTNRKIFHIAPETISDRDFVRSLFLDVESFGAVNYLVLDFEKVRFISRSATHELTLQMKMLSNNTFVEFINLSPEVKTFVELVSLRTEKAAIEVTNIKLSEEKEIYSFLNSL
jgi:anti-anti-sigma regulatory factor